ncbi:histone-fold-containing protein [Aphelenchoides avenae]|nr:histone-fold-containing protein [Aphelenchus avenae]
MKLDSDADNGSAQQYVPYEVHQDSSMPELYPQPESTPTTTGQMILEQDRFLPIANISRIMKRAVPSSGKLSKEAKECLQECVTEFLLFITSEASEKCSMVSCCHRNSLSSLTLGKTKDNNGRRLADCIPDFGIRRLRGASSRVSDQVPRGEQAPLHEAGRYGGKLISHGFYCCIKHKYNECAERSAIAVDILSPDNTENITVRAFTLVTSKRATANSANGFVIVVRCNDQCAAADAASDGSPSLMPINLTAATQDITVVNSGEGPRMDSENGQHPASNQVYYSSS